MGEQNSGFEILLVTKEIERRIEGKSYRKNPHVTLDDLRYIKTRYVDFEGKEHQGELLVHKEIAEDILEIFEELFKRKYPIGNMRLVDDYGADDLASMADNNCSAFNYRCIAGTNKLSNHSFGKAIDINPRINPYVVSEENITPENGIIYANRNIDSCTGGEKKWMIQKGDAIYQLFLSHGFTWGGEWKHAKDYQHFEKI